nr:high-affinity nitrate transporter-activating protein 2.1-like [Ipomoea trifida]
MESYLNSKTLFLVLFFLTFAQTCYGAVVLFSSLPQTLVVSASPKQGQVLKAGEDSITLTWGLNQSYERGIDESYKITKVKLCYAPESQADRAWRKTVDDLKKDKTCQFSMVERPYTTHQNQSFEWMIETDVPTALYFVRAYAYDSAGNEVAYGHTIALFNIQAISGRHLSLDIAAACFSAFALVSVFGFFFAEKRSRRLMAAKN